MKEEIPVPPLPIQKAIANFLDRKTAAIDALIEKKEKLLELLAEKRSALINQAVTKGLDPNVPMKDSGIPWIGEIPAHWEALRVKSVLRFANGQVDPRLPQYSGMPLFAPNHVEKGTGRLVLVETAEEQGAISGKYLVEEGDLVYSKIRPELQKLFIAPSRGLCSADMYALQPVRRGRVDVDFLKWWMLGDAFTSEARLASERVAMPKVNRETMADFYVPVPPYTESTLIARFLNERIARIAKMRDLTNDVIQRLKEYRQSLITAAVTGQLEIPIEPSARQDYEASPTEDRPS